jgi:hypothetical protein
MPRTGFPAWWEDRRQRRYPPEFRIARPHWPADVRGDYERVVAALTALPDPQDTAPDNTVADGPPADDDSLADAAIGLWRAQRRITAEDPDGTSRLTRQLGRFLDKAWTGLAGVGITVHEHDDEPFHDGLALKVLAREPRPGLSRETVVETVSPSVLRADQVIRPGEVIVGYPERKDRA